jgi:hypothetical protein
MSALTVPDPARTTAPVRLALAAALAAALALLAGPAAADTRQFGNLIFDVPQGWTLGAITDRQQFLIPRDFDGRCGSCRIQFGLGHPRVPGQPLDVAIDTLQIVFATGLADRIEVMSFTGPAADEDELTETATTMSQDALPLFGSLRYVSEGAPPLMPPPRPGDLDGLWYGLSTSWTTGLDGMLQMTLKHRILVFWPDGHFYDGTPPQGLQPPDPAALMAVGDTDVGTYALRRGRITLSYASGATDTLDLRGDRIQDGDRPLVRGTPLPDGTPLSGRIASFSYTATGPIIGGASCGITRGGELVFAADGTWTSDAWAGTSAVFDTGAGYATSANSGTSGRYTVRDGLIIRTDTTGAEVARDLAYRWEGDIHIGTDTLDAG